MTNINTRPKIRTKYLFKIFPSHTETIAKIITNCNYNKHTIKPGIFNPKIVSPNKKERSGFSMIMNQNKKQDLLLLTKHA